MRLIVDLDLRKFTTGTGFTSNLPLVILKRGDVLPVEVRFLRGGVPVLLGSPYEINLGWRAEGATWGERVALADAFTAPANPATGYYEGTLNINTTEANEALGVGTASEAASVTVYGEVTWSLDSGVTWASTENQRAVLYNDVNRTDEGTPIALPNAVTWLDEQNEDRGLQPIRSGAVHFFPTSVTVSGEILDDAGQAIAMEPLPISTSFDADGKPGYEVTTADGSYFLLSHGSTDWELEINHAGIAASPITYAFTSAKDDPTGLALSLAGRDDVSILATDGTRAPVVGDRAWNTATNQNFVWGGEKWLPDLENRWDVIVVDGDSRSDGGSTGSWPTRLQLIRPFDGSDVTIVADSGAQAHERLAAFDAEVLPLAPSGSERGLYVLYIGVNDLFQVGGANYTVTRDIYDTIKELWAKARAAGFDVCAVTLQDADHTGTGVPFREERQELLNRMILAGSAHYDFVVPLHELCPDYTVFNTDALHFGADGNQFIAEQVAKILGASDRTANSARQGQGLAEMEFNVIPASINAGRFLWPPYNLAMATEDHAHSGNVTNLLGMKRLTAAAAVGSVAAIRMRWLLVNSANRINWPTVSRYRGVVVSFARGTMSGDHVFRVSVGNDTEVFNVAGFGFELRNNGGAIEMRAIATDSSLVVNNSAWEVIGANANLLVVAFAKGTDVTVLWSASNGSNPYEVWQTISTTGAPTGVGGGGNVCAALETTAASPSAQSVIDVRSIQAFESETLPLSATKFDYH